MSFMLQARMSLVELRSKALVHRPFNTIDTVSTFGSRFPNETTTMATVQWTVSPELGFPLAPYVIRLAQEPIHRDPNALIPKIELTPATNFRTDLRRFALGQEGILCLSARLTAADSKIEIYAVDVLGNEVVGTRQSALAVDGAAFLGPDIFGLRATGAVTLTDVSIFAFSSNADFPAPIVAEVGPPFVAASYYQNQSYLGVRHGPLSAMKVRLAADALARGNTPAPRATRLENEIHRRDPFLYADEILLTSLLEKSELNIDSLIGNGDWSYSEPLSGATGEMKIYPSRLWQYLGLMGPIESTVLGQSVAVPVPNFSALTTGSEIFGAIDRTGFLPFPIVLVDSSNSTKPLKQSGISSQFTHRGVARLTLLASNLDASAKATDPRGPKKRDAPATADIELRFARASITHSHFVETKTTGDYSFQEDERGLPKSFFADAEIKDQSAQGAPKLRIGPVDLPLEGPSNARLVDHSRDNFGRWPAPLAISCELPAWPVTAPILLSCEICYGEDGKATLNSTLGWDWTVRTPFDIRLALLIAKTGDGALQTLRPANGITRPGYPNFALSIRFSRDEGPILHSNSPIPSDVTIQPINASGSRASNDVRTYMLTMPLGDAGTIFTIDSDVSVALCADAWELVSGHTDPRRSKHVSLMRLMFDPRPPVLIGGRWNLYWTSRANGANLASVRLPVPKAMSGEVAGFQMWRASEPAVLDLIAAEEFPAGDDNNVLEGILQERDMGVRLVQIQGLVERNLWKPQFRQEFINLFEIADTKLQAEDAELILSGSQSGLEFAMFTAISRTGVASEKLSLSNLAAIAVPAARHPPRPIVRAVNRDSQGAFATSGLCMIFVGSPEHYTVDDVRIFWSGRSDTVDPAQLTKRIRPLKVLTRQEARKHVPEVDTLCEQIATPFIHIFLVQSPQTWDRQFWSADLLKAHGTIPTDQVAGPRSPLLYTKSVPSRGPELVIESRRAVSDRIIFELSIFGLFEQSPAGYAPCEIAIEIADRSGASERAAPVTFEKFANSGSTVSVGSSQLNASYDHASMRIAVELIGVDASSGRIVARDPVGRSCMLDLMP